MNNFELEEMEKNYRQWYDKMLNMHELGNGKVSDYNLEVEEENYKLTTVTFTSPLLKLD